MIKEIESIDWWHRINIPGYGMTKGRVNHGPDNGDWPTTRFGLPLTLHGRSVIDVGAWDGFFSFQAESRGASKVISIDVQENTGFDVAKRALGSNATYIQHSIEDNCHKFGQYDVVLCFGVLYHLVNPLIAMKNLAGLTEQGGVCLIETAICHNDKPVLEYVPRYEGDVTNFFRPNNKWIKLSALEYGFKSCTEIWTDGVRSTFRLEK